MAHVTRGNSSGKARGDRSRVLGGLTWAGFCNSVGGLTDRRTTATDLRIDGDIFVNFLNVSVCKGGSVGENLASLWWSIHNRSTGDKWATWALTVSATVSYGARKCGSSCQGGRAGREEDSGDSSVCRIVDYGLRISGGDEDGRPERCPCRLLHLVK